MTPSRSRILTSRIALLAVLALIPPAFAEDSANTPGSTAGATMAVPVIEAPKVSGEAPSATPTPTPSVASSLSDQIKSALADKANLAGVDEADRTAAADFYASKGALLWITDGQYSRAAGALIGEMKKADVYGLDVASFAVSEVAASASETERAVADVRVTLAALKYVRQARGGRIDPVRLSSMLDVQPVLRDPKVVLADLAQSSAPDQILRDAHPKHAEFIALKDALAKARQPATEAAAAIDPALLVTLPEGKTLKKGAESDDIALLRKRLKITLASGATERAFDADVETAVKAFQENKGLKVNGQLTNATRRALNREGAPKVAEPKRDIERLIVNMERWRWLPDDLGKLYVMNNVPEFMTKVVKGDQVLFEERIIVGLPTWPTPMMSDQIERVVFNPEWGVPDGIKTKELLPRLKRAGGGGGGFFDQLFGGGSSGGARVLAAYGLKPSLNGRPIDANSVDWSRVDIRRYSFVQPAGSQNPLGVVKFMFPNSHDVYMHDTSQRALFNQSSRALSHGCIRVRNPETLAEILLREDKGWDDAEFRQKRSGDISLTTPIPVYLTYFTARPDTDGSIKTYSDIYGTDSRIYAALTGKSVSFPRVSPEGEAEIADASYDENPPPAATTGKKKSKSKAAQRREPDDSTGSLISGALSGLLAN